MEKKDHVLLGAALTVGAVEDWLGEHVDPETGYVVDDTLAIEGAAADAKATGEAIAAVEAAIPAVDATLATTGAAADAKKTGDELTDLKSALNAAPTEATGAELIEAEVAETELLYGLLYKLTELPSGETLAEIRDELAEEYDWLEIIRAEIAERLTEEVA